MLNLLLNSLVVQINLVHCRYILQTLTLFVVEVSAMHPGVISIIIRLILEKLFLPNHWPVEVSAIALDTLNIFAAYWPEIDGNRMVM